MNIIWKTLESIGIGSGYDESTYIEDGLYSITSISPIDESSILQGWIMSAQGSTMLWVDHPDMAKEETVSALCKHGENIESYLNFLLQHKVQTIKKEEV